MSHQMHRVTLCDWHVGPDASGRVCVRAASRVWASVLKRVIEATPDKLLKRIPFAHLNSLILTLSSSPRHPHLPPIPS